MISQILNVVRHIADSQLVNREKDTLNSRKGKNVQATTKIVAIVAITVSLAILVISYPKFGLYGIESVTATKLVIVPDNYPSIQEAVYGAALGDRIMVRNGTYYERITVNKTVSLYAEYEHGAVVDGLGVGTVFNITANNVSITGFVIRNGGSPSVIYSGILLTSVTGCLLADNYINQCNRGVLVSSSNNNTVAGNYLSSDLWTGSYDMAIGILLSGSSNNTIIGNVADKNRGDGISLHASNYNILTANVASANGYLGPSHPGFGITLYDSTYNIMISNNITSNQFGGMFLYNSQGNRVYGDNFINNGIFGNNAQVWNGYNCINTWDNGYPSGGNYWSDFLTRYPNATQRGTSGLWDTPYVMDPSNIDRFPLMKPFVATTKLQVVARTFSTQSKIQGIFGQTSTVRIGANVTKGIYSVSSVQVTARDFANSILVNNVSMLLVTGVSQYNYRYDCKLNLTGCGTCSYVVYVKDALGNWVKVSGNFSVMAVSSKSNGPWSVQRGNYYNATFTLSANASQAKSVKIVIDIPDWHAVAFISVNGTRYPFQSILSARSGYARYYATVDTINASSLVIAKFTIVTPMSASIGTKTIYYYASWTTTEGFYLTETTHQQSLGVT